MRGRPPASRNAPAAGARPPLRASHADRDRAVEILRVAAGEGRLTIGELDERVGAALSARTCQELAELTADLPPATVTGSTVPGSAVPGSTVPGSTGTAWPEDLVRIDCRGGYAQRSGGWMVPQAMQVTAVAGAAVRLDFTEAVITEPVLRLRATVRGALLFLRTRPGIEVDAGRVALLAGNVMIRPAGRRQPAAFRIEVSGENVAGWLVAHARQYPFWL